MNRLIVFLIIFVAALPVSAQDHIVTTGRDTISCQIIKMNSDSVEYLIIINDIITKRTLPRKYIADIRIAEKDIVKMAEPSFREPQISRSRCSFAVGYVRRLGEDPKPSDKLFEIRKDCFSWETEMQYYFAKGVGIAFQMNGVHSFAFDIGNYGYDSAFESKVKYRIIYVASGWVVRLESDNCIFYGSFSVGPVFYTEKYGTKSNPEGVTFSSSKITAVSTGISYGVGGERKLSPGSALGMKIGFVHGKSSNFKYNIGQTFRTEVPVSFSSFILTTYISFRSR